MKVSYKKFIDLCEQAKEMLGPDPITEWGNREKAEEIINKHGFKTSLWLRTGIKNVLMFRTVDVKTKKYLEVYKVYRKLKGEEVID